MIAYDGNGVIVAWGPANSTTSIDVSVQGQTNEMLEVDAWKVLYVTVWIRNTYTPLYGRTLALTDHWLNMTSFVVESWEQIFPHFLSYYSSERIANRFRWEVEKWIWTKQNGWEPDDSQMGM